MQIIGNMCRSVLSCVCLVANQIHTKLYDVQSLVNRGDQSMLNLVCKSYCTKFKLGIWLHTQDFGLFDCDVDLVQVCILVCNTFSIYKSIVDK